MSNERQVAEQLCAFGRALVGKTAHRRMAGRKLRWQRPSSGGTKADVSDSRKATGFRHADFLRALREAGERESQKYGHRIPADDRYFVMHRACEPR